MLMLTQTQLDLTLHNVSWCTLCHETQNRKYLQYLLCAIWWILCSCCKFCILLTDDCWSAVWVLWCCFVFSEQKKGVVACKRRKKTKQTTWALKLDSEVIFNFHLGKFSTGEGWWGGYSTWPWGSPTRQWPWLMGHSRSASGGVREILFQDNSSPEVANCNKQELQGWRSESSKDPGAELGHCSYGLVNGYPFSQGIAFVSEICSPKCSTFFFFFLII